MSIDCYFGNGLFIGTTRNREGSPYLSGELELAIPKSVRIATLQRRRQKRIRVFAAVPATLPG